MKKYSDYSKSVINKMQLSTDYAYKEGVFKTPQGKFVARVRRGENKTFTTLSQHDTFKEAESAYNSFRNNK